MYQRNPEIEAAPLQSEVMLFNPKSSQFYMLNPTMSFIWRQCEHPESLDSLVNDLTLEFDGADAPEVAADVQKAIGELLSLGLLVDARVAAT